MICLLLSLKCHFIPWCLWSSRCSFSLGIKIPCECVISGLVTCSDKILWLVNNWNEVLKCSTNLAALLPMCVRHILACDWKVCSLKCVGCQEGLLLPLCLFFWSRSLNSRWKLLPGKYKAIQIISIWRLSFFLPYPGFIARFGLGNIGMNAKTWSVEMRGIVVLWYVHQIFNSWMSCCLFSAFVWTQDFYCLVSKVHILQRECMCFLSKTNAKDRKSVV